MEIQSAKSREPVSVFWILNARSRFTDPHVGRNDSDSGVSRMHTNIARMVPFNVHAELNKDDARTAARSVWNRKIVY